MGRAEDALRTAATFAACHAATGKEMNWLDRMAALPWWKLVFLYVALAIVAFVVGWFVMGWLS